MRGFTLLLLVAVVAVCNAKYHDYVRVGKSSNDKVQFRVLLTQQRLDEFHAHVQKIADPAFPEYGDHMSQEEIAEFIHPDAEDRRVTRAYFLKAGFTIERDLGDALILSGAASLIESTFQVTVTQWRNYKNQKVRDLIEGSFVVPAEVRHTVDALAGITHLPLRSRTKPHRAKADAQNGSVIPHFLRFLYNVSKTEGVADPKSSIALVEFLDYTPYSKAGLTAMLNEVNEPVFTAATTVGPDPPVQSGGLESCLDIQYGGAIAKGGAVWYWTAEQWLLEFSQDLASHPNPPLVVSMSWGWPTNMMCGQGPGRSCQGLTSRGYVQRTETEWAKSVARGVTLLGASGDQGAPGDGFAGCQPGLSDIYPGASVYATSVGATMLAQQQDAPKTLANTWNAPVCGQRQCADGSNVNEVVCSHPQALITSGGGFADFLTRPVWQKEAVDAYLNSGIPLPPSQYYNSSSRGFPDIAAIGHSYLVWANANAIEAVDGTSCSTPVWGGLIALANSKRMKAGKKPLGHVAPAIYRASANNFHSITVGNNKCTEQCCSQYGWQAGPKWDACTGRGVPDWAKFQSYLTGLP